MISPVFANWVVLGLFGMGLYCILTRSNLIKIAIGLNIMEAGLLLLLVRMGYRYGARAPLTGVEDSAPMVDPIPHALTLTAIVISAGTTALMLSLIIHIYRRYHTLDVNELRGGIQ